MTGVFVCVFRNDIILSTCVLRFSAASATLRKSESMAVFDFLCPASFLCISDLLRRSYNQRRTC